MARRSRIENDYFEEMLLLGPFGGVDPTSSPYYIAPTNFASCQNIIPNEQFGGFVTVPGRLTALASAMNGTITGIGCLHRPGQPDTYFFAVTNLLTNTAAIFAAPLGGAPTALTLPVPLSPNRLTFFVPARNWVFVSNGVDTPLKIDTSLNVTYWGIVAPATAPSPGLSGIGPLSGTYYYCETFSNSAQESGQGAISGPIVATGTPAIGTLIFGGTATVGDTLTAVVNGIPVSWTVAAGQDLAHALVSLAGQINVSPTLSQLVTAQISGTHLIFAAQQAGSSGDAFTFYGLVSSGASETVSPSAPTAFSGGTDGNSITITPSATTTDPQVTTRNLYRIGGANGKWQLLHSQPVASLTPYLDTISDSAITGQTLTIFRDPPLPFKVIALYQDRIFGFGTEADPTLVAWSNYNEPWAFNFNTNTQEAGPNGLGDVAVTAGSIGSMLLLLKTRSTYAVIGNSDTTFTVIEIDPSVGCISAASLVIADNMAAWGQGKHIRLYDGSSLQIISDGPNAAPGQPHGSNIKALLAALTSSQRAQAVGFYYDRMFCFSYPSINITFVFDPRSGGWFPLAMALGRAYCDPESDVPVIGANLETIGQVDQWFADRSGGDLGAAIVAQIISRITDANKIAADKSFDYLYVEAPVQRDAFVNVYVIVNPGENQIQVAQRIDLGNGTLRHRWELPKGLEGQEVQLTLQTIAHAQATIHRTALFGRILRMHKPSSPADG